MSECRGLVKKNFDCEVETSATESERRRVPHRGQEFVDLSRVSWKRICQPGPCLPRRPIQGCLAHKKRQPPLLADRHEAGPELGARVWRTHSHGPPQVLSLSHTHTLSLPLSLSRYLSFSPSPSLSLSPSPPLSLSLSLSLSPAGVWRAHSYGPPQVPPSNEKMGSNFKGLKLFHVKAAARIWS